MFVCVGAPSVGAPRFFLLHALCAHWSFNAGDRFRAAVGSRGWCSVLPYQQRWGASKAKPRASLAPHPLPAGPRPKHPQLQHHCVSTPYPPPPPPPPHCFCIAKRPPPRSQVASSCPASNLSNHPPPPETSPRPQPHRPRQVDARGPAAPQDRHGGGARHGGAVYG